MARTTAKNSIRLRTLVYRKHHESCWAIFLKKTRKMHGISTELGASKQSRRNVDASALNRLFLGIILDFFQVRGRVFK